MEKLCVVGVAVGSTCANKKRIFISSFCCIPQGADVQRITVCSIYYIYCFLFILCKLYVYENLKSESKFLKLR